MTVSIILQVYPLCIRYNIHIMAVQIYRRLDDCLVSGTQETICINAFLFVNFVICSHFDDFVL